MNLDTKCFFIFIAAPVGHTVVHFGEEIISIMSGTYYIDYSSSVLARTAQLLSTLTWLLNRSRSGDPRSLALSPLCRLDVGADSETSTRFRLSRSQFWVLNIWSFITVMWVEPGIVKWHPRGVTYASPCSWTWLWDLSDISCVCMNDVYFRWCSTVFSLRC